MYGSCFSLSSGSPQGYPVTEIAVSHLWGAVQCIQLSFCRGEPRDARLSNLVHCHRNSVTVIRDSRLSKLSTVTVIPWRPLGNGIGSSNARFQPAIFTEFVTSLFHMRGSDSDEIGPVSLSMVMPCAINETAAFDCNITKSGLFLPIEVIQK